MTFKANSTNEAIKKVNSPDLKKSFTMAPKSYKKEADTSKEGLKKLATEEGRAEKYDMTIDAIRDITDAFNLYAKKEKTDPSNKTEKIP
jgi:hypothetical protein